MTEPAAIIATVLRGPQRIASGPLADAAAAAKRALDDDPAAIVLIFDDTSGEPIDVDFRGSVEDVRRRLAPPPAQPRGPGRPRLGVTAREVTLLPRPAR